ncbi:TolB family protein [Polyangium aurulentum]|uniref:TolB family protein n=1 Tax=Polyangium aurulentum TaxID=2567896 RepID=UPI0010AE2453|nr:PD40 domain-containing protein [Polyangium aurulentum]UQA60682.1 PD40 domain-containing protein [Polyangium aurulentum]
MRHRLDSFLGLILCLGIAGSAFVACADTQGTATTDTTGGETASLTVRLEPAELAVEVGLDGKAAPIAYRAFAQRKGEAEVEVTKEVNWTFENPALGDVDALGNASLKGLGGETKVLATYEGVTGSSALTIKLRGEVFLPGTDESTKTAFDSASPDPNPANAPLIEYPEDGAVLPANLPPIEAQWTPGNGAVYRVRLATEGTLDIDLFTTGRELAFPVDIWKKVRSSAPDTPVTLEVEGLDAAGQLRAGSSRTLTVASDGIDESAIYVWQSSTGSFRVLDIIGGTDIALPNNSPVLAPGQPCSGCHRISRDGKRFAYTFQGGNFEFGTLAYDAGQGSFVSKINPSAAIRGTYAAFNPLEGATRPAMLLTSPDSVPQNTPGTVRLTLVDPDTSAPIPTNLAEMTQQIPASVGRATMMPDWSPNGGFVVFTAYDSDANYVRLLGDDVVLGSIVEAPVNYNADGSFQFGAPKVLVTAPAGVDPDTGENNVLPSISPDGELVAFTRANGWWSIKTQQSLINLSGRIAMVRRSDGAVIELSRGASNGPEGLWSSTWPQWAPTVGQKYIWLAYASERPYGHKLTPQNSNCGGLVQGQRQCKQLWITAIDREKLAQGAEDPSMPGFWIPGQSINAQYVSPQWTVAVLNTPK